MTDPIRWAWHHPRRLYTIAIIAGAAVLGLALAFIDDKPHPRTAAAGQRAPLTLDPSMNRTLAANPTPSVASAAGQPHTPEVGHNAEVAGRTAIAFTTAWAAHPTGQSQQQWLAAVAPYATGRLRSLLTYTDVTGQPNRRPVGQPIPRYVAVTSAQLVIGLSDGSRVAVTVVHDNDSWKVFDIEPDAGDGAPPPR